MDEKEKLRLQKEPFQTMVPVSDSVKDLLRGWKPPVDTAYILFQSKCYEISKEEWRDSTFTLNVDGRPEQYEKVTYYVLNKGFKIIHYGNFPKANHPNPRIAQKAKIHTGPDQVNPWDVLESMCKRYMGIEQARSVEISELKQRVEKAEAALASEVSKKTKKVDSGSL